MDVIKLTEPKASNSHNFMLVAIDYFTKWVEVVTFKAVTKKAMVDFVHSHSICHFSIPKTIATNNAENLKNHLRREVCDQWKIPHHNSNPYIPKANDIVKAVNKNIKKILRKVVQGFRQWHEKMPFALMGYPPIVCISVGATPYPLVYRSEVVIPSEVEIPSLQTIIEVKIKDDEWVKTRLKQLILPDEKWLATICHGMLYQQIIAHTCKKKVRPR
ncbi:uncharacterized protein LOC142175964 [Nicotiana tabacum]|uniref:Uncharacterized protein LOC142175964 n=1 Tax=Nicotiana tabacum TaxID=4097 RepID=A0AC58TPC3_TOBAC